MKEEVKGAHGFLPSIYVDHRQLELTMYVKEIYTETIFENEKLYIGAYIPYEGIDILTSHINP